MTPVHRGGNKIKQNSQFTALAPPPPEHSASTAFNSYQLTQPTPYPGKPKPKMRTLQAYPAAGL